MMKTTTAPALYVGTYDKYNNGSIAGEWLELDDYSDADEFIQSCKDIHSDESDPEFMFQDHEFIPEALYSEAFSKYDLERLFIWLHLDNREAVGEYLDEYDPSGDVVDISERYLINIEDYRDDSLLADHEELLGYYVADNGLVEIPENLETFIDYWKLGRSYMNDLSVTDNGHVFFHK